MLIDGGDGGSGSGGGGSGEDIGKLTRKRLNRGLPGRKQGTVRIQVGSSIGWEGKFDQPYYWAQGVSPK